MGITKGLNQFFEKLNNEKRLKEILKEAPIKKIAAIAHIDDLIVDVFVTSGEIDLFYCNKFRFESYEDAEKFMSYVVKEYKVPSTKEKNIFLDRAVFETWTKGDKK